MKGLIVSLVVFLLYVIWTAAWSHVFRLRRHALLLFPAVLAFSPVYFILFILTPPNCFFLPEAWLVQSARLDMAVGFVIFLLNCHSYIDFFYGFNCGFSAALLLEMLRAGNPGLTAQNLVSRFRRADGSDKIFAWRLPGLEAGGYIRRDAQTGIYQLTGKGLAAARLARFMKRLLNLGAGG